MNYRNKKYTDLEFQVEGHLLWIYLNRPTARNAFSDEMIESLVSILQSGDLDPEIRVMIISGRGDAFCAGGDTKAMEQKQGMFAGESNQLRKLYKRGIQTIPKTFEQLETPVIAMVNGPAIGAGCDLSCMCDIRIGSTKAVFGETFSKLALVPGDGGTFFLPRVVGYAKAMEMFLTGDLVKAEAAKNIGLLNELVEESELIEAVRKKALKIASNAPVAIGLTKRALAQSVRQNIFEHLELLAAFQGITQRTSDHFEGVKALHEKREAYFQGE